MPAGGSEVVEHLLGRLIVGGSKGNRTFVLVGGAFHASLLQHFGDSLLALWATDVRLLYRDVRLRYHSAGEHCYGTTSDSDHDSLGSLHICPPDVEQVPSSCGLRCTFANGKSVRGSLHGVDHCSQGRNDETGTPLIVSESFNQTPTWTVEGRRGGYTQDPMPGCEDASTS